MKRLLLNETFEKKMLLLENRLIEKMPAPCNAKEHYLSFIRIFFKPSKCKNNKTNPELQLKDTESKIKSKLINSLFELRIKRIYICDKISFSV